MRVQGEIVSLDLHEEQEVTVLRSLSCGIWLQQECFQKHEREIRNAQSLLVRAYTPPWYLRLWITVCAVRDCVGIAFALDFSCVTELVEDVAKEAIQRTFLIFRNLRKVNERRQLSGVGDDLPIR